MSESQKSGDIPLAEEVPVSQLKLVDSVKATIPAATPVAPHEPAAQLASSQPPASISTEGDAVKILVAFYSMYGHVERLAQAIVEGVNGSLVKVECKVRIIPETLSEEARKKMHAAPSSTFPTVTPEDLVQADGIIFGFPTRFGMPCAQAKSFLDSLGSVWESGASIGKTAGVFVSTGTLGGGQETTAWTSIAAFSHLGMAYVPMGEKYFAASFCARLTNSIFSRRLLPRISA
eukprot:Sdes_comp19467_c0_seq1m10906